MLVMTSLLSLGIGVLVVLLGIFASISYGAADIPILTSCTWKYKCKNHNYVQEELGVQY